MLGITFFESYSLSHETLFLKIHYKGACAFNWHLYAKVGSNDTALTLQKRRMWSYVVTIAMLWHECLNYMSYNAICKSFINLVLGL